MQAGAAMISVAIAVIAPILSEQKKAKESIKTSKTAIFSFLDICNNKLEILQKWINDASLRSAYAETTYTETKHGYKLTREPKPPRINEDPPEISQDIVDQTYWNLYDKAAIAAKSHASLEIYQEICILENSITHMRYTIDKMVKSGMRKTDGINAYTHSVLCVLEETTNIDALKNSILEIKEHLAKLD